MTVPATTGAARAAAGAPDSHTASTSTSNRAGISVSSNAGEIAGDSAPDVTCGMAGAVATGGDPTSATAAPAARHRFARPWPTGFAGGARHAAVEQTGGARDGVARCGVLVRLAGRAGPFQARVDAPSSTCAMCSWSELLATGAVDEALAQLPFAVRELAARIIARTEAEGEDFSGDDPFDDPDPYTLQLLAATTTHAPIELIATDCFEGGCDHLPGACPAIGQACGTCSLIHPTTDAYLPDCTVAAPCSVLTTLADSFALTLDASLLAAPAGQLMLG